MRTLLVTLVVLSACNSGKGTVLDDTGETDADTDADSDTDTDSDSDSDTDVDTVTFDVTGDWEGTTLAVTWISPFDKLEVGETVASVDVTDEVQPIDIPTPSKDDLQYQADAGVFMGFYMASLHEDDDGNGIPDSDETIRGASDALLAYILGNLPPKYEAIGLKEGWNALKFDFGAKDQIPELYDIDAVPISTSLDPDLELTFSGTYEGGVTSVHPVRLALVPLQFMKGAPIADMIYDEPLGATWEIALDGAPPSDHITDLEGVQGAIEYLLAYSDEDNSGSPTAGDLPVYTACFGEYSVFAYYIDSVQTLSGAFYLTVAGIGGGWSPIASRPSDKGDDVIFLTDDQAVDLVIGPDCATR